MGMKYKPFTEHVMEIFILSTADVRRDGSAWYTDAHNVARDLDPENVGRAAGVLAALSPLNGWSNNKRMARAMYDGQTNGLGMNQSVTKALRILCGEHPLSVLGGDKVRAFYSTILDPYDPNAIPVIDRHAHDIAVGAKLPNNHPSRTMTEKRYKEFAETYCECARTIGIGAPQLQAITWLEWRNRHGLEWYG
jgi:hypothetical protein